MKRPPAVCAALVAGVLPAVAAAQESRPYPGYHMWGDGWHGMFFGPLFMLLLLAAVVVVVVLLLRWLGGPASHPLSPHHTPGAKTPLDILKERFARGEIDKEEFEERRRVLGD